MFVLENGRKPEVLSPPVVPVLVVVLGLGMAPGSVLVPVKVPGSVLVPELVLVLVMAQHSHQKQ